ncbi:carboxypeptidase regulatory-like domain-containing protein [Bremerella sp. JC770]|uniref:carboxypeptidase regulatory-like domain-containing protein n=1 Tax=Bremerella sp. JC770 TaxID=3232137 RepID=UPI00345746DC
MPIPISTIHPPALSVLLACGLALIVGCQNHSGPELATVAGTVTLDGEPLKDATVHFQPASGRPSYGKTDDNGKYNMGYNLERQGVALGEHVVIIRTVVEDKYGKILRKEMLPRKYHDQTTLSALVEDKPNVIDFDLESK